MLTQVNRAVLAVRDRADAARGWVELLGAEHSHDDRVGVLAAKRSSYRLGNGWVELLEAEGAGPVADAVAVRGSHLFATGATTPDLERLIAHLESTGVEVHREQSQAWIGLGSQHAHGFTVELAKEEPLEPVGLIDEFYEASNLVHDADEAAELYSQIFALDADAFCPIQSDNYGYHGTLTLFHPDRIARFEVITPTDPDKTMGRFFTKAGPSLYMMFAETDRLDEIAGRAETAGIGHTREKGSLFLHPAALGGMMLGLSRRSLAWLWSGHPERVLPE